jgi:hypothetical protein
MGTAMRIQSTKEREMIMVKKNTKTKAQAADNSEAAKPAKAPTAKVPAKRTRAEPEPRKTSALDAAVRVLAGTGQPMNSKELIDQMATKGYWTSPGGKTPHATLHAAISREIKVKGKDSRFVKAGPGQFTASSK